MPYYQTTVSEYNWVIDQYPGRTNQGLNILSWINPFPGLLSLSGMLSHVWESKAQLSGLSSQQTQSAWGQHQSTSSLPLHIVPWQLLGLR